MEAANLNGYCGKTWVDAYNTCVLACPNRTDSECAGLGDGYRCQNYTMCDKRIQEGQIVPSTPGSLSSANIPSKQLHSEDPTYAPTDQTIPPLEATKSPSEEPTRAPTEQTIPSLVEKKSPPEEPTRAPTDQTIPPFEDCPQEYSAETEYSLGALIAYPINDIVAVYECQGDLCNSGPTYAPGSGNTYLTWGIVGSCGPSATPSLLWWLEEHEGISSCVYNNDYPEEFIMDENLKASLTFESKDECCTMYADACKLNATGVLDGPLPPKVTQTTAWPVSGAPTFAPQAPTTEASEYPTEIPTYVGTENANGAAESCLSVVAAVLFALACTMTH